MTFPRVLKYYFIRFLRIKGEPHELAIGMALGIFSGMMPVIPFHMVLAVALALVFRVSKITAALGCWVSNPLTWAGIYYFNYKIGAGILGLSGNNRDFSSIMETLKHPEEGVNIIISTISAGSPIVGAFLIGGVIMGIITGFPSYFIFLKVFRVIKTWREKRRALKQLRKGTSEQ
ncbi:DUF2062 domain-containing protein [Thermodesulfobacteriota bacterium]